MSHRSSGPAAPPDNQPSRFEQTFGPSCLLSLIIVFLLLLVIRRFAPLTVIGVGAITVLVWFGVFSLLLRWRLGAASNPAEPDAVNEIPADVVEAEWWNPDDRRQLP